MKGALGAARHPGRLGACRQLRIETATRLQSKEVESPRPRWSGRAPRAAREVACGVRSNESRLLITTASASRPPTPTAGRRLTGVGVRCYGWTGRPTGQRATRAGFQAASTAAPVFLIALCPGARARCGRLIFDRSRIPSRNSSAPERREWKGGHLDARQHPSRGVGARTGDRHQAARTRAGGRPGFASVAGRRIA